MKMIIPCVLATALATGWCGSALADVTPQVQDGIPYISGGVGSDETQAMRDARTAYNVLMTFAIKDSGEYQADVDLKISGKDGKAVAAFKGVGPLLYAKLAPGRYTIEATARGKTVTQAATVGSGGASDLHFYWSL